jgi:type IV pilus assembly protein PilW
VDYRIRPSSGFGLIEIMVAIVISLLASLAIYQTFSTSEGFRRATLGNGNAQSSGGIAIMQIQKDLERAGYGIGSKRALNCNVVSKNANYTGFRLVPALITSEADSDQITILYSNSTAGGMPALFGDGTTHTNGDNQFANILLAGEFITGDLVVAWPDPGNGVQTDCPLFKVTCTNANCVGAGRPPSTKDFVLRHDSAAAPLWNGTAANHPFPAHLPINTTQLFNFGTMVHRTYCVFLSNDTDKNINKCAEATDKIDGSLLSMDRPKDSKITASSWKTTSENVIQLKAQYGLDKTGGGGNLSSNVNNNWTSTTPANLREWQQLIAIRYAVLVRSNYPEKPDRAGNCNATTDTKKLIWSGGAFNAPPLKVQPSGTSWQCYRYTVHETVVPLRNQLRLNQPDLLS